MPAQSFQQLRPYLIPITFERHGICTLGYVILLPPFFVDGLNGTPGTFPITFFDLLVRATNYVYQSGLPDTSLVQDFLYKDVPNLVTKIPASSISPSTTLFRLICCLGREVRLSHSSANARLVGFVNQSTVMIDMNGRVENVSVDVVSPVTNCQTFLP
ncbi:hypothetical protein K469DRAFT_711779 [Zopfia rhizophila CBS 207.26]|uniref:Uncharacterized protein n=1 Tax=Zopfia rhizophila CBS 207.26 TaxID=1314779 RepID=A0A6A6DW67_9PEZI|nr:hypothetical protein K469DRAFT_711779 [Zopfia rhizophila CBS 207.26]